MNITHLHLLLNHFPIVGTLIGSGLLLWGIVKNQNNIKSIAAAILVLMALIAIPVYLSGEPAEESIEKLAGVSESAIEIHEHAAVLAIWLMGATGVTALVALFLYRQKRPLVKTAFLAAFILSVISFAAMARTGYSGGQIRHSEISSGAAASMENNHGHENVSPGNERNNDDD